MFSLALLLRSDSCAQTHTPVKEALSEPRRRHLQPSSAAVIRTGVNADSWMKLFNNLAAIKMRKTNGVKMHINLFLIWISGLVRMVYAWRQRKNKCTFSLQPPNVYVCEIKTDSNSGGEISRAASSKRLSSLR